MRDAVVEPGKAKSKSKKDAPIDIDATIAQIESFYSSLTGADAPPVGDEPYAVIPPEREPREYVEQQLDRLLQRLGSDLPEPAPVAMWVPRASLQESPESYTLCLDLPGVLRSAVRVTIEGRQLSISGERQPSGDVRCLMRSREYPIGRFERKLFLPADGIPERLEAVMKAGVLEISLPRVNVSNRARTVPLRG